MPEYTTKQKIGLALMGLGGGLTGQNILGNYLTMQEEQKKLQAEQQFRDWQMKNQELKNQIALAKMGYIPSKRPISTVPPGQFMELGGQGYRFTPEIAKQQMMAQIAPYMAMMGQGDLLFAGMTGKNPTFKSRSAMQEEGRIQAETQKQKDIQTQNVKREIYSKDLSNFFAVDDVLQQARGQGLGRLTAGGKMT